MRRETLKEMLIEDYSSHLKDCEEALQYYGERNGSYAMYCENSWQALVDSYGNELIEEVIFNKEVK